jgi:hypothetical protein
MAPKFREHQQGFGAGLECPACGSNDLHHDRVEIFECGEGCQDKPVLSVSQHKCNTSVDFES